MSADTESSSAAPDSMPSFVVVDKQQVANSDQNGDVGEDAEVNISDSGLSAELVNSEQNSGKQFENTDSELNEVDNEASAVKDDAEEAAAVNDEGGEAAAVKDDAEEAAAVNDEGGEASAVNSEGGEAAAVNDDAEEAAAVNDEGGEASAVNDEGGEASAVNNEGGEAAAVNDDAEEAAVVNDEGGEASAVKDDTEEAAAVNVEGEEASAVKDKAEEAGAAEEKDEKSDKEECSEAGLELQVDENVAADSDEHVNKSSLEQQPQDVVYVQDVDNFESLKRPEIFNESNPESLKADATDASMSIEDEVQVIANGSEVQPKEGSERASSQPDNYIDILGNGQLLKKTLQKGEGEATRPKNGYRCTLSYEARLGDQEGDIVDKEDSLTVTIGDYDFLQAFDIALMLTELNERCEIRSGPQHAYGTKLAYKTQLGREIPSNSTLTFIINLFKVEEPINLPDVSLEDLIGIADAKRERGNFWFNRDESYTAVCCYARAAALLEQRCSDDLSNFSNTVVQAAMDARVRVYNNLAACQLKLESWDAAIESCNKALRLQAGNAKTLYRKGRALVGKGDPAAALQAMRAALAAEPDSRALQNEVSKLTIESKRQQTASQDLYRRMMGVSKSPGALSTSSSNNSPSPTESSQSSSFMGRYKFWLAGAIGSLVVSALLAGAAYRNNR